MSCTMDNDFDLLLKFISEWCDLKYKGISKLSESFDINKYTDISNGFDPFGWAIKSKEKVKGLKR